MSVQPSDLFLSPNLTEEQARHYLGSLGFRDPAAADQILQTMAEDLGVRLALGADRVEILRMVLRQGAVIALAGIGVGLAGALIAGQVLRRFLFGVEPTDPVTLAGVSAALGVVAAAACLVAGNTALKWRRLSGRPRQAPAEGRWRNKACP